MESQLFDQFLEDSWPAEPCGSKSINTPSDLWLNYLWFNQYNPFAYNFEDLQSIDGLESGFNLSELPSPISDSSSHSVKDPLEQQPLTDSWVIPTTFENSTSTPSALCICPFRDNFPVIAIPSVASSPGSPEPNLPQDVDAGTKRRTMRARKHWSENTRVKSPCSKGQNAHNLIEKRYRTNLNSKITALRDSIPSLRSAMKEDDGGEDAMDSDIGGNGKIPKCNKGIVLDKAIKYIAELERRAESLSKENSRLQLKVRGSIPSYSFLE
ncbi:hypothetical protein B0O99DRAFT_41806 [Bisporella sp. PMI_857]|nr:hypothetical protein B0O99DRAFT_41806 [Bisporella sp. PMI_857]